MLFAYTQSHGKLIRLPPEADIASAVWVDLYRPLPEQIERLDAIGVAVPSLADMEEIEISNRLYRADGTDYMTVVLPGLSETMAPMTGPVTFILTPQRLVTVRHHVPRPFETFPERADKAVLACTSGEAVFLGLAEEIIGRLADLLEGSGRNLDAVSQGVFAETTQDGAALSAALRRVGREGDLLGRVRLALLTLERAIGFYAQGIAGRGGSDPARAAAKALTRDIQALEVHADFISNRVALATDATLGMINLAQNSTVRIVSVVAVLFLPPTLIASVYGMNFRNMPEVNQPWGYPAALGLMLASAVGTYLFFKWKKWL